MSGAYAVAALALFAIGLHGVFARSRALHRVLGLNVMGSGVFLFLIVLAERSGGPAGPDPVPQAMVLTGLVISVSVTALALALGRDGAPGEPDGDPDA